MMAYIFKEFLYRGKRFRTWKNGTFYQMFMFCHSLEYPQQDPLPPKWYEKAFGKIANSTHLLKNLDVINGRLVNIIDDSTIIDDHLRHEMHTFKSFVRIFIGSPSVQQRIKKDMMSLSTGVKWDSYAPFSISSERYPILVDSLSVISNYFNISAQQKKLMRFTICPQVTQHRIWIGALEEVLNGLKVDLDSLNSCSPTKGTKMGQQVVHSCLKFLRESSISFDPAFTSWMRLLPSRAIGSDSRKWEDVLDMFKDLVDCLRAETELKLHVAKLEGMKEGLFQVKDMLVDKSIGYKEVRHQESLVQKKLSKTLGHSSKCLFTLLLYYLYGSVSDFEVDVCGGVHESGSKDRFCLSMGRILTSDDENTVWSGMKQLDKALGLFKFVWETAGLKGHLDVQGHLWCVGAEGRIVSYKGNTFFLHNLNL